MSKWSVLVLGDDPEALMAPYDMNLEVAPYEAEELDVQELRDWFKKDPSYVDSSWSDAGVVTRWAGREGESWRRRKDGVYVEITTYNSRGEWDAHWPGYYGHSDDYCVFELKPVAGNSGVSRELGRHRARKWEIDLETTFAQARKEGSAKLEAFNRHVPSSDPCLTPLGSTSTAMSRAIVTTSS